MAFTDEQIKAFPAWLQKLAKLSPEARTAAGYTDEDLEQATKAYHLDRDYTQKAQKAAELEKIQEQYPDLSLDDAAKVWTWWRENGEAVRQVWPHRERIQEILARPEAPKNGAGTPAGSKRRWRDAEAADLYETARLREVFEDLGNDAVERATKAVREDWYQKEEVPRLDKVAAGYLSTVVDLVDFVQQESLRAARDPQYTPIPVSEVLKEAAARGEKDFRKVAKMVGDERGTVKKAGYDEGYQKGVEEGKKASSSEGPSGPLGAGQPAWRPAAPEQKPKTREERAQAVVATVEKKYGQKLPL